MSRILLAQIFYLTKQASGSASFRKEANSSKCKIVKLEDHQREETGLSVQFQKTLKHDWKKYLNLNKHKINVIKVMIYCFLSYNSFSLAFYPPCILLSSFFFYCPSASDRKYPIYHLQFLNQFIPLVLYGSHLVLSLKGRSIYEFMAMCVNQFLRKFNFSVSLILSFEDS